MIDHPFVGDLSHLTIEELTEKVSSLTKKMSWAASMGNHSMAQQIQMVLGSYRREISKKQAEMFDDTSSTIKGKIDIN
jgi:hypothetical protein